jgi:hypothetical protein
MAYSTNEPDAEDLPDAGEQSDEEILEEARERYAIAEAAESENRVDARDDLLFLKGGTNQWDPIAVQQRTIARRPMITVNSLPTYLHQVTNDQRQNTPSIKVHPVGDSADDDTAKVRQGMIRHIEYESNADAAYDTAVNSAAGIGFGYFRLVPEYYDDKTFNQKLCFKRIRNALSVKIDPLNTEPDGSGMQWCFIESLIDRKEFKRQFPKAKACDASLFNGASGYSAWGSMDNVLICEYYRIEKTAATVVLLSNGESGFKDDLLELPPGVTIEKERPGTRCRVMWHKITAVDILEKTEIKCKWIPVFPVYGDEIDIEGKVTRSGMIRNAKGPAQSYNVFMTVATEEVSARSKSPWVMAEGQEEGHEDEWGAVASSILPYVLYKPTTVDGHIVPAPQRQPMADIPVGFLALAMHAGDNVKQTTGVFTGTFQGRLGAAGTAKSGIQEQRQQSQGEMASFHYMDGLMRAIRQAARCLNYMIPYYYDWQGAAKIMNEDGTIGHAPINTPQVEQDETGQAITRILNDMTGGEYDTTVSSGPSYSTLRQEAADGMAENMAKNPGLWNVIGDLYVKNQDWPGADEMAERIAKTIPPQIRGPQKGEPDEPVIQTPQGPIPAAQAGQMIAQMQEQLQQAQETLKKADIAGQQLNAMKQQQVLNEQQLEPQRQQAEQMKLAAAIEEAKAKTMTAQADLLRAQAEAQSVPHNAAKGAQEAQTAHMKAQVDLLHEQQRIEIEAANAAAEGLNGEKGEAFEAWKAALEAHTRIRVAEITAGSKLAVADKAAKAKPNGAKPGANTAP